MPLVELTPENRVQDKYEYPKLWLKKGERARILVLEAPTMNFVHTLRAPRVESGRLVTNSEGKPEMDFIGRPICLGDFEVLSQKASDPENCPMCAESKNSDKVEAAVQRYAMNVIKYSLKPGSHEISKPLSVELVVWSFGPKLFNVLVGFADEWKSEGGLKQHDLLLGPCEIEPFQRFDISVSAKAGWLESKATKTLVAETYKASKIEDLDIAIGRKLSRELVQEDLNKVLHANRLAYGGGLEATDVEVDASIDTSLGLEDGDDLFGDVVTTEPDVPEESAETETFEDLLADI